jgi:hypothetical protein
MHGMQTDFLHLQTTNLDSYNSTDMKYFCNNIIHLLLQTFDSKDDVKKKVAQLAKLVQEAHHVVFHTGAGISTSAGIPDFRCV